ncbi:MAG: DUF6508 domain-containing protein [Halobacteriota archaeon]
MTKNRDEAMDLRLRAHAIMSQKMSKAMKDPQPISKANIEAIVRFLPIFTAKDFKFGEWGGGKIAAHHFIAPYFTLSSEASAFYKALYDNGWIIPFDWPSWQEEAVRYVQDQKLLEQADAETLRKLLTTHVRKDRFCEGHLASMFESGHIIAILLRLQKLSQSDMIP